MRAAEERSVHFARNEYYDRYFQIGAAKILPGEFYATDQDKVIVTVLGSCVSACIRDSDTGIGGMNHFMLPLDGGHSPLAASARYGVHAMELLINELIKLGARRDRLRAKVFGGANVMPTFAKMPIGRQNAEFVQDFLAAEGIPIDASDLLANHPRKVYFFPASGRVLVKKLRTVRNATVLERERQYNQELEQTQSHTGGDVDLFLD